MAQTIIVTGVSKGIGKAIAIYLSQTGYQVAGIYKSDVTSAIELESKYNNIKTYKCDVSIYNEVLLMKEKILKDFGNVFGIVNNAGIALTKLFCDTSEQEYNNIMDTNIKGTFNVTKAFLPILIKNKQGKIVNISSMWGITGGSCEVVYSASKAAVIGLTKALAKEVGLSGIQVNCIAPGVIQTDMISNLPKVDKDYLAEETPLGRIGNPEDVAKAVYFLLSDLSDFITGQVINTDGGMVI